METKKRAKNKIEVPEGMQALNSENTVNPDFINSFSLLLDNRELMFQLLEQFPFPIEIFDADGTSVFFNRAGMELNGIKDASLVIGKYNLKNDPVCNDELGMRDGIERAFRGEAVNVQDFPAPIEDLVARGVIKEKPYEKAIMDLFMFPVMNGGSLAYVVCVFLVKSVYIGKREVASAKEYLQTHWRDEFDKFAVARAVNMSVSQLYSVFKRHTGMTPMEYHNICRVDHIKEKLADKNLTIAEAFLECGESSRGWIAAVFKKVTGMTPTQYRDSVLK